MRSSKEEHGGQHGRPDIRLSSGLGIVLVGQPRIARMAPILANTLHFQFTAWRRTTAVAGRLQQLASQDTRVQSTDVSLCLISNSNRERKNETSNSLAMCGHDTALSSSRTRSNTAAPSKASCGDHTGYVVSASLGRMLSAHATSAAKSWMAAVCQHVEEHAVKAVVRSGSLRESRNHVHLSGGTRAYLDRPITRVVVATGQLVQQAITSCTASAIIDAGFCLSICSTVSWRSPDAVISCGQAKPAIL